MIKKTLGIEKGSGKTPMETAGTLTKAQARQIAEDKLDDLNTKDVETAMKIVEGTARSMGIDVEKLILISKIYANKRVEREINALIKIISAQK